MSNKALKFIHITKTAGTSIEDCAKKKGILFGRFHKEYGFWHHYFTNKPRWLKLKYDWFTVVMNPYERIISEYHCKDGGIGHADPNHSVAQFNSYVRNKIMHREPWGHHYAVQHRYIDANPNVRIHVIKFENVKEDFDKLMRTYHLDVTLDVVANKPSSKIFHVSDLSEKTVRLINEVYAEDFRKFGYQIKNTFHSPSRYSIT